MELNIDEKKKFLSKVDIFSKCKGRDLKTMAKASEIRTFKSGDYICRQGQKGVAMFIVINGKIKIEQEINGGNKVEIAILGPEAAVGEMAILDGAERVASVVAVEETTCLLMTAWDFKAILKGRPEIALDILPVIVARFRDTAKQLRQYGQKVDELV